MSQKIAKIGQRRVRPKGKVADVSYVSSKKVNEIFPTALLTITTVAITTIIIIIRSYHFNEGWRECDCSWQ